jgi:hypothetical protein
MTRSASPPPANRGLLPKARTKSKGCAPLLPLELSIFALQARLTSLGRNVRAGQRVLADKISLANSILAGKAPRMGSANVSFPLAFSASPLDWRKRQAPIDCAAIVVWTSVIRGVRSAVTMALVRDSNRGPIPLSKIRAIR